MPKNKFEEILLEGEQQQVRQETKSHPPQGEQNNQQHDPPAPALESFLDFTATEPTPPPEPNRNNPQNYDRNHWSRLLNNAKHMAPSVRRFLVAMYNAGVRLVEKKERAANGATITSLKFVPGVGEGWQYDDQGNQYPPEWPGKILREIVAILYTQILYSQAVNTPAKDAVRAAIRAGGRLAPCAKGQPGVAGFRFDWSRAGQDEAGQAAVAKARAMLDQVGGDVKRCIEATAAVVRQLGCVVALTEMAEVEDYQETEV